MTVGGAAQAALLVGLIVVTDDEAEVSKFRNYRPG